MKRIALAIAATATAALALTGCSSMNHQTHHSCTVTSKERLIQQGSSGEKRVYTDCGSFVVNDSISGGFNSQDTFNQLIEGRTYDIETGDYRVGFLSMFPNIIGVTEVAK